MSFGSPERASICIAVERGERVRCGDNLSSIHAKIVVSSLDTELAARIPKASSTVFGKNTTSPGDGLMPNFGVIPPVGVD